MKPITATQLTAFLKVSLSAISLVSWGLGVCPAFNHSHMCLCASHCYVTATASSIASLEVHCRKWHIQLILSLGGACLRYNTSCTISQSLQDQTHVLHKSSLMHCVASTVCKDSHCTVSVMDVQSKVYMVHAGCVSIWP